MGVFGDMQQLCPCYKKYEDFHKLIEFKDFVVYSYRMRTENVRQAEAIDSTASATRYVFILHNKKNVKITTSKIMSESGMKNISCPRCKKTFEHAQKLIQDIKSIDKNTVMAICDHCRKNAQTNKNPFCACEELVKKFVSVEGKQKGDTEKRAKMWLSKIKKIDDSEKPLKKPKQIKTDAYSNLKISRDFESPTARHKPKVEQMFYSDKHFQSDDTEMSESDLKEDAQTVRFIQPTETLETSLARTPHLGEKKIKVIPSTSTVVSGATIAEMHVGVRDLPRSSLKDRKQAEIFQYDIPSMDAKEVLKRRHDLSLRHMMRYEKKADDPFSLTDKASVYDISKNAQWEQKTPTSEYNVDPEMGIYKKPVSTRSKHDLSPGGTHVPYFVSPRLVTSPKTSKKELKDSDEILRLRRNVNKFDHKMKRLVQHKEKSKSEPSQAVGDVGRPQYSFYFPKETKKEEQKKLLVSSSQLIKDTQEKYHLQAEKKKKKKEEERLRKLEEEQNKKLAREEKRLAEEDKRLAREEEKRQEEEKRGQAMGEQKRLDREEQKRQQEEKRRQAIEGQKRLAQEKKLIEIDLEPNKSQQKIKVKIDKKFDEINKDKKSKTEKGVDDKSKLAEKDDNKVKIREQKSRGAQITNVDKPQPKTKDDIISKREQETKGKDDELTQKRKEDEENKERLRQEQLQKAKEDKDEKEKLKQEQLQKAKEDKDEKERLKQEQLQKDKKDNDEKERLKQEQLKKDKKDNDEKGGLKQEQLQKAKEDKDENGGLKQEPLQKEKKEKQLKDIDAASKKAQAKQDEIQDSQQETVLVSKGKEKESKRETSKKDSAERLLEFQRLQKERLKEKEQALKQKQEAGAAAGAAKAKEEAERKLKAMELEMKNIIIETETKDIETLEMVRIKQAALMKPCDIMPALLEDHKCRHSQGIKDFCPLCLNSELEFEVISLENQSRKEKNTVIIIGEKIFKYKPTPKKVEGRAGVPLLFEKKYIEGVNKPPTEIKKILPKTAIPVAPSSNKGITLYTLSDRTYIDKGWTLLPTEKVMRKMNIYRMRPAHPEFDWFEHNKKKGLITYDTGEKLAEFDDNGRGRLYYKNGRLALDYYDAKGGYFIEFYGYTKCYGVDCNYIWVFQL